MRSLLLALTVILASCAYTPTPKLQHPYDLGKGYRFERLSADQPAMAKNSDELFVVLAFSGGGTRAAALSYGVLDQLRNVTFRWDAARKAPCTAETKDCVGETRTLLDEVDVISSVSGGSFTSAYYALNRDEIFSSTSRFHTQFLYYPVQRDLVSRATYYPASWTHLLQRVEIAADLYADRIFGSATFGALEGKGRPYVILNATDASTGGRFEFTQEQFDIVCADLSQFPIARGITASSAFPGLLNSMTIDARNRGNCSYRVPDWVPLGRKDASTNYPRYRAARDLDAYLDTSRPFLHLLDGGPADNIGLRSALQSLNSTDQPLSPGGVAPVGGWSLLDKINQKRVKTILVVTVNARTNSKPGWDGSSTGPIAPGSIAAAVGTAMGNYTAETLELLRQYGFEAKLNKKGAPRFIGLEVAFENLEAAGEPEFFGQLGTNFELDPFEVDCLRDRGALLLREAESVTEAEPTVFAKFVERDLGGHMVSPSGPSPAACTVAAGKREIGTRSHYVDIGYQHTWTTRTSRDVAPRGDHGVAFRVTKPNGLGATLGYSSERFDVRTTPGGSGTLGQLTLRTISAGALYARRLGPLEVSLSASAGFGFGGFSYADAIRDTRVRSDRSTSVDVSNAWVVKPALSLWYNVNNRWAVTASGGYVLARPRVRASEPSEEERTVRASGIRLAAGLGMKVF